MGARRGKHEKARRLGRGRYPGRQRRGQAAWAEIEAQVMGRITRNEEIVRKMEAQAINMLDEVADKTKKHNLDTKMDVFERVGKWIAIKNKLENDDGGGIAEFKRRLHGESETDKHYPPSRRPRGSKAPEPANGGSRLDAIRSKLPSGHSAGADGDSGVAGSEGDPAHIGNGSDPAGVPGHGEP